MTLKKLVTLAGVALASAVTLVACAPSSDANRSAASGDDAETLIKVGVMTMTEADEDRWDKIEDELEKAGHKIDIEYTQFTDYSQPNLAVAEGEVDINAFQHHSFLNNWNSENNGNLVAILDTYLSPIRLYSGTENGKNKYTSVNDIPENGTIAIPNDPTNGSRALYVLQSAGLLELSVSGDTFATVADIKSNPKNLTITELDASQTANSLIDVDAAIVNNSYAVPAKLDYKNALFVEKKDENSQQWVNVIAAPKDWKNSDKAAAIQAILDAYYTDSVKTSIEKESDGLDLPVW
ncbi:MetQ/NlpA family ABC transporter substrate-binding protein [Streptococcus merionis]|uniref:Lipoprotein n=1 Tax=Streptococcus merionis TaxID=400065 RepID=A0A239SVD4_9STRE|nr:MetQ/NlpA family ABC transporter substrate-binding protein [Streptococcus merionis]SNU89192.1 ABC transporter substrate-binding protein [Streptococcus merionis]